MRAKHEGTYEDLPKGKVRLVVMINRQRHCGPSSKNKGEAKRGWEKKFNQPAPVETQSLSDYIYDQLEGPWRYEIEATTQDLYRRVWRTRIYGKWIGKIAPQDITTAHCRQFYAELNENLMPRSAIRYFSMLRKILAEVKNDCAEDVKDPKVGPIEKRLLEPQEEEEFLAMFTSPRTRAYVALALHGATVSEIAGLPKSAFDGIGVTIDQQAPTVEGKPTITKNLKRERRRRWIPLSIPAREAVKAVIKADGSDLIFPGRKRKKDDPKKVGPMHRTSITRTIARICDQSEKFKGVRPHALRSAFAMRMLEASVDVRTAAEILGNDPAVLVRSYTKSRPDVKLDAVLKTAAFTHDFTQRRQNEG